MKKMLLAMFVLAVIVGCSKQSERKLVWSDEFDYQGLPDSTKWTYEEGYERNNELQYYTKARLENARVQDGVLIIDTRKDNFEDHPITSASVTTEGKASWSSGRIEVRAKIPSVLGSWPAIWMLGVNRREVGWPTCGEIDILEHVGYNQDFIHANVHTKTYNHAIGTGKGDKINVEAPYSDFHIYAVEWTQERMDFFFDDQNYFSFENEGTGNAEWPYDKPHYLILNTAFGGAWGGNEGVDESELPIQFLIDYVRVYE
jgi:beta-glucanase (GH16 family)